MMVDSKGVIYEGRTEGMNEYKEEWAVETDARTLDDAMDGADVFVGLSDGGHGDQGDGRLHGRQPHHLRLWPIPIPEILPEEVAEVRDDAIMATGRSRLSQPGEQRPGLPLHLPGRSGRAGPRRSLRT